jgi:hypothetical protein
MTKIRQREAIEIRQGIGGGCANDGQSGEGHRYRRHSVRSYLCRLRLWYSFIRCFGHLRSLHVNPVARLFLAADQQNQKEPLREAIHRRLSRDCLPK